MKLKPSVGCRLESGLPRPISFPCPAIQERGQLLGSQLKVLQDIPSIKIQVPKKQQPNQTFLFQRRLALSFAFLPLVLSLPFSFALVLSLPFVFALALSSVATKYEISVRVSGQLAHAVDLRVAAQHPSPFCFLALAPRLRDGS